MLEVEFRRLEAGAECYCYIQDLANGWRKSFKTTIILRKFTGQFAKYREPYIHELRFLDSN